MEQRLRAVWGLLAAHDDVLAGRVTGPEPPGWCVRRGWTEALLGLDDAALAEAEVAGLAGWLAAHPHVDAPRNLRDVAEQIAAWTSLAPPEVGAGAALRKASPRKRAQVAALVAAAQRLRAPGRVVDVGAGQGHLTRELAKALGVPAVGIEQSAANVAEAQRLSAGEGAAFVVQRADAQALRFGADDLAVGLHACGGLGDALVEAAARDGADLLLVNCCLQKVGDGPRQPVSALGRELGATIPRARLGLTNLLSRRTLVERDPAQVMAGRQARYGLRLFLTGRGLALEPGEEMRGLHKRWTFRGLAHVAERACAKRGLAPPTPDELTAVDAQAAAEFARVRRLSLARSMFGRLLELAIVLDRAQALAEAGHQVRVEALFPVAISPRNLAILARA